MKQKHTCYLRQSDDSFFIPRRAVWKKGGPEGSEKPSETKKAPADFGLPDNPKDWNQSGKTLGAKDTYLSILTDYFKKYPKFPEKKIQTLAQKITKNNRDLAWAKTKGAKKWEILEGELKITGKDFSKTVNLFNQLGFTATAPKVSDAFTTTNLSHPETDIKADDTFESIIKQIFPKGSPEKQKAVADAIEKTGGKKLNALMKEDNFVKWKVEKGSLILLDNEGKEDTYTLKKYVGAEPVLAAAPESKEASEASSSKFYELGKADGAKSPKTTPAKINAGFDATKWTTHPEKAPKTAMDLLDIFKKKPDRFDAKTKALLDAKMVGLLEELSKTSEADLPKFEKKNGFKNVQGAHGVYNIIVGFQRALDMYGKPAANLKDEATLEIGIRAGTHVGKRDGARERFSKAFATKEAADLNELRKEKAIKKTKGALGDLVERLSPEGRALARKGKSTSPAESDTEMTTGVRAEALVLAHLDRVEHNWNDLKAYGVSIIEAANNAIPAGANPLEERSALDAIHLKAINLIQTLKGLARDIVSVQAEGATIKAKIPSLNNRIITIISEINDQQSKLNQTATIIKNKQEAWTAKNTWAFATSIPIENWEKVPPREKMLFEEIVRNTFAEWGEKYGITIKPPFEIHPNWKDVANSLPKVTEMLFRIGPNNLEGITLEMGKKNERRNNTVEFNYLTLDEEAVRKEVAKVSFEKGKEAYGNSNYAKALKEFQQAYAISPLPKLAFNIGKSYQGLGKFSEARQYYLIYEGELPGTATAAEKKEIDDLLKEVDSEIAKALITELGKIAPPAASATPSSVEKPAGLDAIARVHYEKLKTSHFSQEFMSHIKKLDGSPTKLGFELENKHIIQITKIQKPLYASSTEVSFKLEVMEGGQTVTAERSTNDAFPEETKVFDKKLFDIEKNLANTVIVFQALKKLPEMPTDGIILGTHRLTNDPEILYKFKTGKYTMSGNVSVKSSDTFSVSFDVSREGEASHFSLKNLTVEAINAELRTFTRGYVEYFDKVYDQVEAIKKEYGIVIDLSISTMKEKIAEGGLKRFVAVLKTVHDEKAELFEQIGHCSYMRLTRLGANGVNVSWSDGKPQLFSIDDQASESVLREKLEEALTKIKNAKLGKPPELKGTAIKAAPATPPETITN